MRISKIKKPKFSDYRRIRNTTGFAARIRFLGELLSVEILYIFACCAIWPFSLLLREGKAVMLGIKKYAVFTGRATRSDFLWFTVAFAQICVFTYWKIPSDWEQFDYNQPIMFLMVLTAALIIPFLSFAVRRCHDVGRSGWWSICPIFNIVIFLSSSDWMPESNEEGTCITVETGNDVVGDYKDEYHQHGTTCAVKAQQIILNEFGIKVSEDECVEYARSKGWFQPNGCSGTPTEAVGKLLEHYGVPYHIVEHATLNDLMNELSQGRMIIVGVDHLELYAPEFLREHYDIKEGYCADHVILVDGIDVTDADQEVVYITDTGAGIHNYPCPMEYFLDAWQDAYGRMWVTNNPVPGWNPEKRVEPYKFDLSNYPDNMPRKEKGS